MQMFQCHLDAMIENLSFQKFFQHGSDEQRGELLKKVWNFILRWKYNHNKNEEKNINGNINMGRAKLLKKVWKYIGDGNIGGWKGR